MGQMIEKEKLLLAQIFGHNPLESNDYCFIDKNGNTSLHIALKHGLNKVAEEILRHSPSLINVENNDAQTPIFVSDHNNNLDGVKLCLEYHPLQGTLKNNCSDIFDRIKDSKPYYIETEQLVKFYQPISNKNADKLVIIIDSPDIHIRSTSFDIYNTYYNHFLISEVPTLLIGNRKHSLSLEFIKKQIVTVPLPENIAKAV